MIREWGGAGEKGREVDKDEDEGEGEGEEDKGRKHNSREMKNVEEEEMNDNEGYDNKVHTIRKRRNNYNSPKIIRYYSLCQRNAHLILLCPGLTGQKFTW